MSRIDGGPAFARSKNGSSGSAEDSAAQAGMSLRDYFAGQVCIGLSMNPCLRMPLDGGHTDGERRKLAREAYAVADAMLLAASLSPKSNRRAVVPALDPGEMLRELCHQIEISGAVDENGHELRHLKVLADARQLLARIDGEAQEGGQS